MLERAKHEAEEIVAKAKTDAEALIERRTRMAEDKIAAEERTAVEQLRAAAADAATKAAARLIAERHDASTDAKLVDQAIKEIGRLTVAASRGPPKAEDRPGSAFAGTCYCWCWPPGWVTPSSACSAVSSSAFAAEVAEADDAAQPFLLVDHRQPADLRRAHLACDFLDVVVGPRDDQDRRS